MSGRVIGNYRQLGASLVSVALAYSPTDNSKVELLVCKYVSQKRERDKWEVRGEWEICV